jgi:hypothetical protein
MADGIVVGVLKALLTADTAQFEEGMRKGSSSVKKFTDDTEKQSDVLAGLSKKISTALAAAFTVTAVVAAGKQVLDFADNLSNLSQKTGIGTTGLQKLQLAFQDSGVSIETVTKAATELGARLVGEKGAADLVKKLGLNLDELKKMSPEEQFLRVADAVGNIQNKGEQIYASKTLFGKGGAEMLQGLTGHLRETTDQFESMGLIVSEETVKAADAFGDQLGLIGKQLLGILANALAPMLPALSALASGFASVASIVGPILGVALKGVTIALVALWENMANFLASLGDLAQKVPLVGKYLGGLSEASDWLRKSAAGAGDMIATLVTGTDKTAVAATKAQPALIGLGDAQEKAATATKQHAESVERLNPALEAFYAVIAQDEILQNARVHVAEFVLPFKDLQSEIPKTMQYMGMYMQRWNELSTSVSASADDMQAHTTSALDSLVGGFKKGLNDLWSGMSGGKGFAGLMNNLGDSIIGGFGNIISGGLTSVINMGVQLAVAGVEKIGKLIGGLFESEETRKVNKPRDQFFGQFGGYDGLAKELTQSLIDQGNPDAGNVANDLITALYGAKTESNFHSAEQAIADVFNAGGKRVQTFHGGGIVGGGWDGGWGEVMVKALPGEGVLNRSATASLGAAGVGALNAGRFPGSASDPALHQTLKQMQRSQRDLPRMIGIQLRDALAGV